MKRTIITVSLIMVCLTMALPLFAEEQQPAAGTGLSPATAKIITAGFAMAFASALCGIAQGLGISAACKGASRNPAIAGKLQMMMIIGLVFIESLVLYTLLIVFVKV